MTHLTHDLKLVSRLAMAALALFILCSVAVAYSNLETRIFAASIMDGTFDAATVEADGLAIDERGLVISQAYSVAFLLSAVLGGIWIYRAARNAQEIQPLDARITPGWAVGWFFIPFAGFWMPFQSMRQTFNTSDNPTGAIDRPIPGWIGIWWGAWVVANLLGAIGNQLAKDVTDAEGLYSVSTFSLVTMAFTIAAAVLFFRLIRHITTLQSNAVPGVAETFA